MDRCSEDGSTILIYRRREKKKKKKKKKEKKEEEEGLAPGRSVWCGYVVLK